MSVKLQPGRTRKAADELPAARTRDPGRTRAAILESATQEFATHGLGGARVDAIAARAGVNKRMLYHYFGDKDGLFVAVMEAAYEEIRRRELEIEISGLKPADAIAEIVRFTFRYFRDNPDFIALLSAENMALARHVKRSARVRQINQPIIGLIDAILAKGRKAGAFRGGVDALQLYLSISGLSYLYFCNIKTLSVVFDRDLAAPDALARREAHAIDVILGYLRP